MAYPIYQPPQSLPPGLLPAPNEGLLGVGNPLLNIGLGILASNQGNYGNAGAALGKGAMLGLQQNLQQQQFAQTNKLRDVQMKAYEREAKADERKENALRDFDEKFPQFAGLADINPAAAMKIAYPNLAANTADPYFSDRYIGGKIYSYDHRTGEYIPKELGGTSSLPNKDDPTIQGNVAGAKAQAGAAWNPNTDIDGVLTTDERVVRDVYGNNPIPFSQPGATPRPQQPQNGLPTNNFNTPYPVTFGAPGTTATDRLEGTTTDNLNVGNPARPNPVRPLPGGGIRVPTAAEKAAEKTTAEEEAKFNSSEAVTKREKAADFKRTMGNVVVSKIDDVIKRVDGFSAGFGGSLLNGVPGTPAYDLRADLETIKANFGFDRLQAMRDLSPTGGALGQVAVQELAQLQASVANLDSAQSPDQLKANLKKAKTHYDNWLKTIEGGLPSGEAGGRVGSTRPPMKGQVVDGFKFKGGDPSDPANWEKR